MTGRTFMWILRSVAFCFGALYFLGSFILGGGKAVYMIGAIGMGAIAVYSIIAARASSKDDKGA